MSAKKAASGATLKVKQLRSGIGYNVTQKSTLKALGLGKIGRTRELPDNPQVRGMVNKIRHIVAIVDGD